MHIHFFHWISSLGLKYCTVDGAMGYWHNLLYKVNNNVDKMCNYEVIKAIISINWGFQQTLCRGFPSQ